MKEARKVFWTVVVMSVIMSISGSGGSTGTAGDAGSGSGNESGEESSETSETNEAYSSFTWTEIDTPDGLDANDLEAAGDTLYLGTVGHIYSSQDAGETWTEVGTGLPADEYIWDIRVVGDDLYASVIVGIGGGCEHKTLYYFDSDDDEWVSVGGLHQHDIIIGDEIVLSSDILGFSAFEDGGELDIAFDDIRVGNITMVDDDLLYAVDPTETKINLVDLAESEMETIVNMPDDGIDYVSDIFVFKDKLYINASMTGVFSYDIDSVTYDLSNPTSIPIRDSNDSIDIGGTVGNFFVVDGKLYRSGGGSAGGVYYELVDGKFIAAAPYTPDGYLESVTMLGDKVCGISNNHLLYCGQ